MNARAQILTEAGRSLIASLACDEPIAREGLVTGLLLLCVSRPA